MVADAICWRKHENQGEDVMYDFACALSYAGISLERADGESGKFVEVYCPTARMPSANRLHDSHLLDVHHHRNVALTAKIAYTKTGIIVDESPDVAQKQTANILFSYYDANHNIKTIDSSTLLAWNL